MLSAHISLAAISMLKSFQFKALNARSAKLMPQRQELEELKKKYAALTYDGRVIQALDARVINWPEKLKRLSIDLPSGIWFNELNISRRELVLKGSAISLEKEEMSLIKKFLDNLKSDAAFLKDLSGVELGALQKRLVPGFDIVDFTLAAKVRPK